jgi:hypothetical protein
VLGTISEVLVQLRYNPSTLDILEILLQECTQNESNRAILDFSSIDIWQGLFYLINQGMLKRRDGSSCLVGTFIEGEKSIAEMAQRLGQYMYVLNQ